MREGDRVELLFDLAWKTSAAALAIVLVAKMGERGGALMASIVMTFPMNAGPGFFFMALAQPAEFIGQAALISFAGAGAVFAFVALYVRLARSHGFMLSLGAAVGGWFAFALITAAVPLTLASAMALIALGGLLVVALKTARAAGTTSTLVRASWHYLLARGLLAGVVIASVAQFASVLGPTISGLAYAFPVTIIASMWVLYSRYGSDFALATMARVPAGFVTYVGFCLMLHVTAAGGWPPLGAWTFATIAAILIAALRASTGHRRELERALPNRSPWSAPKGIGRPS